MKFLKIVWNDLRQGENIDLYLTIVAALGISILNLTGLASEQWIPTITLAVLALLAVTNLVNRHKLDEVILQQQTAEHFIEKYPASVSNDIKSAKELWLVGYVLSRTLMDNLGVSEEKLAQKKNVKVLLFNPDSDAVLHFCASMSFPISPEETKRRITSSLETLKSMSQVAKKQSGRLEVRLIDHPLFFGTYAMDLNLPNGVMYIELYKYKGKVDDEPKLVLHKKDGHWFDLYKEQLTAMWQDAKPYSF
jgi:hypothetical protein